MPRHEYAARHGTLPPPPHVVWDDLVAPRRTGARVWLDLRGDERVPRVLESVAPIRVVWSSLWPDLGDDRVELTLSPRGADTRLDVVVVGFGDPPSSEQAAAVRHRLGELLFRDLRLSYGQ
ncbi:MAG: hypothetical protein ABIO16_16800 [Nocardioides sp.]